MNPLAFIVAVAVLGFVYVIFRHMIEDCFSAAKKATDRGEAVFQGFLGLVLCLAFMGLSVGLLLVGTQPRSFFQ